MQIDEDRTPMGGRAPGDGDEDRLAAKNLTGPQGVLSEIGVTRKGIFFDV